MKNKLFYALNVLLLMVICLSSCKKEKLDGKTTTDKTTASSENKKQVIENQLKLYPVEASSPVVYIGNSEWEGNFAGVDLIFSGVADYQLMDGKRHLFNLVSTSCSGGGSGGSIGGNCFTITKSTTSITTVSIPKVDWVNKITGIIEVGLWYIPTSTYSRTVGSYSAQVYDWSGEWKQVSFSITIVQVDDHLEIKSYTPGDEIAPPDLVPATEV